MTTSTFAWLVVASLTVIGAVGAIIRYELTHFIRDEIRPDLERIHHRIDTHMDEEERHLQDISINTTVALTRLEGHEARITNLEHK